MVQELGKNGDFELPLSRLIVIDFGIDPFPDLQPGWNPRARIKGRAVQSCAIDHALASSICVSGS